MARGKKKEAALSPAERLQAALVPESEQPYQVPENWCWVKLGKLSTSQYGYTAKAIKNDTCPKMLRITDIQDNSVDWDNVPNCQIDKENFEKYALSDGDIVIARTGATTGKSFLLNNPYNSVFASYLIRLRISKKISRLYAFEFLQTDCYWKQISELSSGIAQPGVNATKLQSLYFPLAPLAEQQRIVDRIETLFAKLDEAKQKAQDALDSFETRKAAILHKAFTGELTAQWRKEHSVGMESWDTKPLSKITNNHDSKRIPLSQVERSKLARIYDYYGASGVIDKVDRFLFEGRKLLIGEDGANLVTRSKPIAFIAEGQYWVNNHAHVLSATPAILLDFLCHYINSIDLTPYVTGSAQPKMTQAKMNRIPIPIPIIDEQVEIVRILDDILAKEQQAKEAAEKVLEQIELTKKAILARAFRGELGTNDPGEESAVEMLKAIL